MGLHVFEHISQAMSQGFAPYDKTDDGYLLVVREDRRWDGLRVRGLALVRPGGY